MTADLHPAITAALRDDPVEGRPARWGGDLDWDAVVTEAEAQALTPLVRHRLRRRGWLAELPSPTLARLDRLSVAHAARALLLIRTQASVLSALAEAGVRAAPLRGPALGERLYDDAALRPCGDVDVLVDRAALEPAERALAGLGFREVDRRTGFARQFSYALELVEPSHGIVVEPHFSVGYPPFTDVVPLERVWSRVRRARVAGVETLALAPEATLLNLCLHVVHKAPDVPALWLYDLDRLVRREGDRLDWAEFVTLARASRLAPLVAATLRQALGLFDAPIPGEVLAELERAPASPLARLLSATSVDGKESLAALLALPTWGARLRYASAVLFPSPHFMTLEYGLTGSHQLGAAYVRRVGYFTWQGLKGVLRLCC